MAPSAKITITEEEEESEIENAQADRGGGGGGERKRKREKKEEKETSTSEERSFPVDRCHWKNWSASDTGTGRDEEAEGRKLGRVRERDISWDRSHRKKKKKKTAQSARCVRT